MSLNERRSIDFLASFTLSGAAVADGAYELRRMRGAAFGGLALSRTFELAARTSASSRSS